MLSIETLSRTEKLRTLEELWDDLSRDSVAFASPQWHAEALQDAERALAEKRTHFVDWDAAKKLLRDGDQ